MIKDQEIKEITREDIYAEYFSRQMSGNEGITADFAKRINRANKLFRGKTKLEIMIRGTILFNTDYKKLFTFLNKTYTIGEVDSTTKPKEGLEECLLDIDNFQKFMSGDDIHYFSSVENEYVNYTRVLNAYIIFELT